MTARRESMPTINGTEARWDAEAGKVRYYASFEGTDDSVEVSGEDFSHLSRHFAQETADFLCDAVSSTIERVNVVMDEFAIFRKELEVAEPRAAPSEGRDN